MRNVRAWERWVVNSGVIYNYTLHRSMNVNPFKSKNELVNWGSSATLAIL